ncbi:MAG: hypothetical protein AB8G11_04845 [Saprospiraceae bacterium]
MSVSSEFVLFTESDFNLLRPETSGIKRRMLNMFSNFRKVQIIDIHNSKKMCQSSNKIRFCTCENSTPKKIIHNKKSRRFKRNSALIETDVKAHLTWHLYRKIEGTYENAATMDGMFFEPLHQITEELTPEFIVQNMNTENCFDFDYQPVEGDELHIWTNHEKHIKSTFPSGYLSFLFTNNQWEIGSSLSFDNEEILKGKVKIEE